MNPYQSIDNASFAFLLPFFGFFAILIALEVVVRGYALWRAGRNKQPIWFVCLLVLNTAGILPALYILFFQKNHNNEVETKVEETMTTLINEPKAIEAQAPKTVKKTKKKSSR